MKNIISFVMTNDTGMKSLNKTVFKKDRVTDVISLPVDDMFQNNISYTGEIVVNTDEVKRNSREFGVSEDEEMARVVAHGLLHLLGYEDNTPEAKRSMTVIEDAVVQDFKKRSSNK